MSIKINRPISIAVLFYLLGQALDIGTSMAAPPMSFEENPFMRDPLTLQFVLWKGLAVKGIATAVFATFSATVYNVLKRWQLQLAEIAASIPWLYVGAQTLDVAAANLLLVLKLHT